MDGPSEPLADEVPLLLGQLAGPIEAEGQEAGPLLEADADGQLEVPWLADGQVEGPLLEAAAAAEGQLELP